MKCFLKSQALYSDESREKKTEDSYNWSICENASSIGRSGDVERGIIVERLGLCVVFVSRAKLDVQWSVLDLRGPALSNEGRALLSVC